MDFISIFRIYWTGIWTKEEKQKKKKMCVFENFEIISNH